MFQRSPTLRFLAWPLVACLLAGLLLALLAPFETARIFTLEQRLLFWPIASLLGGGLLLALYLVGRGMGRDWGVSAWLWLPLSALVAAAPETLIVQSVARAVDPQVELLPFAQLFPSVLLLCLPLQAVLHLVLRQTGESRTIVVSPKDAPADPPLFGRLPPHLGSEILCIKTEDHYLQVHTDRGQALILMRMADAERALADKGLRVHRGWWVARHAVSRTELSDGKLTLTLVNGLEVPVARDRRRLVEAEGWLPRGT